MEAIFMKQRAIILVPFPFSDQSGQKIRPALVISNDTFNKTSQDLIVCSITSTFKPAQYSLIINQDDLEQGTLPSQSAIKVENIFKIEKSLIIKTIGTLQSSAFLKVIQLVHTLLQPSVEK